MYSLRRSLIKVHNNDLESNNLIIDSIYSRFYINYNESRDELVDAACIFYEGLQDWKDEQVRKALFGFMTSAVKLAFGVFPCGAAVSRS